MTNNNIDFNWIPFYMELAKALLLYKSDRKPLVDWIYSDLSQVSEKSLVGYIHMRDKSKVTDIDPFSVFAIFNRNLKIENKVSFLQKFKKKMTLKSEVPVDFSGIPTVDSRQAFFFSWNDDNAQRINDLWDLFERVVQEQDISQQFDKVIADGVSKYSLTMILFWIAPNNYLGLDSRNRSYLNTLGIPDKFPNLNYAVYSDLLQKVKSMMGNHTIPFSSFPELSFRAWNFAQTGRIWMYKRFEDAFSRNHIRMGSSAKGMLDFSSYKSETELGNAYRKVAGNKDKAIPHMYWMLMNEVKVGDIVVVFDTKGHHHLLYGWGKITSDVFFDTEDDNPIHRNIEWHLPTPKNPIEETRTNNTRYFHEVKGIEAANIMNLLGINTEGDSKMEKDIDKYVQLLRTNKNIILTGAPGTGKTYLAKEIAKQLLDLDSIDALKTDKRFGFVQFHPSYDYTDFVEGLRPIKDPQNGVVGFKRQDGAFKEFCKQAILSESADADVLGEINNNPIVWKVSLEGTGDNPTRKDCMDNGYIRIGWFQYGDVEDFFDYNDFSNGGKNVLRAFQSGMQVGDLVVSCYSAKEIDAIGIITGDYEYRSEGGDYPRYRTVKWLVKNIRENIVELNNNKSFTSSTVYKASITADSVLKIVKKYNKQLNQVPREDVAVFVIDEINRGEISKIFGELFFSIDPSYRGIKGIVKTQYQNLVEEGDAFKDGFYVPENVYVIGTMNDIDRSVESMDFAMRRRFAWKEITAESRQSMLDENKSWGNKGKPSQDIIQQIKNRMNNLNAAIIDEYQNATFSNKDKIGLSKAYQIGAAYFLKMNNYLENGKVTEESWNNLWENHLKGLLYEYLRGKTKIDEKIDRLHQAYNDTTTH